MYLEPPQEGVRPVERAADAGVGRVRLHQRRAVLLCCVLWVCVGNGWVCDEAIQTQPNQQKFKARTYAPMTSTTPPMRRSSCAMSSRVRASDRVTSLDSPTASTTDADWLPPFL